MIIIEEVVLQSHLTDLARFRMACFPFLLSLSWCSSSVLPELFREDRVLAILTYQFSLCLFNWQMWQLQLLDLLGCAKQEPFVLLDHFFLYPALQVGEESFFHKNNNNAFCWVGFFCTDVLFSLLSR